MSEVASLELKVSATGVDVTNAKVRELADNGKRAETATNGLAESFKKLAAPVLASVSAFEGLKKLVEVNREFDKLNAGLITATGSSGEAAKAFEALQEFAQKTPFSLRQTTEAFVQLVNRGLSPSERALTAYGNLASALGTGLNDVTDAISAALRGEYEPIKKYVSSIQKEGDKLSIGFRGTTTKIGNNAKELQAYLINLSETNFGDAMTNRMNSLDGALSNLGDEWDKLFLTIGKAGVGQLITDAVHEATDALAELSAMIASGELPGYLQALAGQFAGFGQDAQETGRILVQAWRVDFLGLRTEAQNTGLSLSEAFRDFGPNVRTLIQAGAVEIAAELQTIAAYSVYWVEQIKAIFTSDTLEAVEARLQSKLKNIEGARSEMFDEIVKERDAALNSYNKQIEAAKKLREEYDQQIKAKREANQGVDRLAGYEKGGKGKSPLSQQQIAAAKRAFEEFQKAQEAIDPLKKIEDEYEKRQKLIDRFTKKNVEQHDKLTTANAVQYAKDLEELREKQNREVDEVKKSLLTQEESIADSYRKRREIVENSLEDPEAKDRLLTKLQQDQEKELADLADSKRRERQQLDEDYLSEEQQLMRAQERKHELLEKARRDQLVTEERYSELLVKLADETERKRAALSLRYLEEGTKYGGQLFANLADAARNWAGEQSGAYKALFAAQKAFAVAQTTVAIASGIANAQKLIWPANLVEGIRVAALGAQLIAQISGANYSGAYDAGGYIPAGRVGLVGERRAELVDRPTLVQGPANVTGGAETARMFGRQQPVQVTLISAPNQAAARQWARSAEGRREFVNIMREEATTIRAFLAGG